MNTKGIKFLAVLAVLAMAFAAFAIFSTEGDAAATGPLDFESNVTDGTNSTSNIKLGNAITVSTTAPTTDADYYTYTLKGVLAYDVTDAAKTAWGMGAKTTVLVFNYKLNAATDNVWISTDGSSYTRSTDRYTSTTTEPVIIGCANSTYWFASSAQDKTEAGEGNANLTNIAKVVLTANEDPNVGIVKLGTTASTVYDGTAVSATTPTGDVVVTKSTKITYSATATGANEKGVTIASGKNVYIASGAELTIEIEGTPSSDHTVYGLYMTGTNKVIGLGSTSKLTVNSHVTTTGWSYTSGESMIEHGIYCAGAVDFINLNMNVTGKAEASAALRSTGNITIDACKATFTAGNRGIYFSAGTFDVKNGSTVTATGGEFGIKTAGKMTVGTTADDTTVITAKIGKVASQGVGSEIRAGIYAKAEVEIKAGSKVTADSVFSKAASITVSGTLNVLYNDDAGRSQASTRQGAPAEEKVKYIPAGIVIADAITSDKITNFGTNTLTIKSGGLVTVSKDAPILAVVSDGEATASKVQFGSVFTGTSTTAMAQYTPLPIVSTTDVTLSFGSVKINGEFVSPVGGKISVPANAKVELSGQLGCDLEITGGSVVVTVPSGETLTISEGKKITATTDSAYTVNVVGEINGAGSIEAGSSITNKPVINTANPDSITIKHDGVDVKQAPEENFDPTGKSIEQIQEVFNNSIKLKLTTADITVTEGKTLTIPSSLTLDLGGKKIITNNNTTVGTPAGELVVKGAKISDSVGGGMIEVNGMITIDAADVCVDVKVDSTTGYASILNPKNMSVKGELTSNVSVGYGNVLTLEDVTVPAGKKVEAFGKLVVVGTNVVKKNANVFVYTYGSAQVTGTLNIEGNVSIYSSLTNEGTVTVSNDNGGAILQTVNKGYVYNMGLIDVVKPKSSSAVENNKFIASDNAASRSYDLGSMRVTGLLVGNVYEGGELTFNGTSDNATIYLIDGTEFKLTSVTGTMFVKDEVSSTIFPDAYGSDYTLKEKVRVNAGNAVTLTNVKGVTVKATVASSVKEGKWDGEDSNIMSYVANLEVSGAFTALDETADAYAVVSLTGAPATWTVKATHTASTNTTVSTGKISVSDSAVGKNVNLDMNTNVKVTGSVSAIAKTAYVTVAAAGKVNVSGEIIIGPDAGKTGYVQGVLSGTQSVSYVIQDADANDTTYYTSLAKAMDAVGTAYDNKFTVIGTNSITSGNIVIPADVTVDLVTGAELSIGSKATIEVAAGGELNGVNGTISVTGVLTIDDKNTGLKYTASNFTYQVYKESGAVATYTGILGALASAEEGDVITIQQDSTVKEALVIPEGVTLIVPSKKTLTFNSTSEKIKVSVTGVLELQRDSTIAITGGNGVEFVIKGVVAKDMTATVPGAIVKENYVKFEGKIDGRDTEFWSNLEFAADNCDTGDINVYGQVSAGDITLSTGESKTTAVALKLQNGTEAKPTSVSVSSITLDGASIVVGTTYQTFSGSVIADAQGDEAIVNFASANNFTVESAQVAQATGNIDYLYVSGTPSGIVTFSSGIATVKNVAALVDLILFGEAGTEIIIDDNAVLEVPKGTTAVIGAESMDYATVIDGTLAIAESEVGLGYAIVNGMVTVEATTEVYVGAPIQILGTLNVIETEDKDAKVRVNENSSIILGDAPGSLGAAPAIIGPVELDNKAYIVVYDGDLSEAKINWHSAMGISQTSYTEFYINDELYMTAIGTDNSAVYLVSGTAPSVISETFKLAGLNMEHVADAAYWKDISGNELTAAKRIGAYETIFFKAPASVVDGTISVGAGIYLYVDGKGYSATSTTTIQDKLAVGTHTVKVEPLSGYDAKNVTISFNGVAVTGGTFTLEADADDFMLVATGATPVEPTPSPEPQPIIIEEDDSFGLTQILLIALVIMIGVLVVVLILRFNRS